MHEQSNITTAVTSMLAALTLLMVHRQVTMTREQQAERLWRRERRMRRQNMRLVFEPTPARMYVSL